MIKKKIEVINKLGLHARAAAKLVETANKFKSEIILTKDKRKADARSIMKILMLSASKGTNLIISVDGEDQSKAMTTVTKLFEKGFDEKS